MSLSTALNIAQSSIRNAGRQTTIVSRNIQDAGSADYNRRIANLTSTAPGARMVQVQRAANEQLFRQNLAASSDWSAQSTLYDGMTRLGLRVNGADNAASASTALGKLQQALQLYATTPSSQTLAESALDAARAVVRSLNDGTAAIQGFRLETDQQIALAVDDLNGLLAEFKDINNEVVAGTRANRDVSDALDRRDAILKQIAEHVPVSTLTRSGNDMVILTKDGATLFETVPRAVSFVPSAGFAAGINGSGVYVDGVPLTVGASGNAEKGGRLAAMLQLRDGVAATMQAQLDEVARGLISAFSESDRSPTPTLPDRPGLFTWPGAPAMPAAGTLVDGLAGRISLNAAIDSRQGGSPQLLRDGGANGAAYVANTGGGSSYSTLLIAYGDRLDQPMAFDAAAGLSATASVSGYASNVIGWFEGLRATASTAAETKQALAVRTADALSNETGVNVDMEMSLLLELEHSYQASARLIQAVDEMLQTLLAAVR